MEMLRSWRGHVALNPLEGGVALIIGAAGFGDPEMVTKLLSSTRSCLSVP